jgi:hypothetical protein
MGNISDEYAANQFCHTIFLITSDVMDVRDLNVAVVQDIGMKFEKLHSRKSY